MMPSLPPLKLLAISSNEADSHVWMGLLRDKDLSLRSLWCADDAQARETAKQHTFDLLISTQPLSVELVKQAASQGCVVVMYVDAPTHKVASWFDAGAEMVQPRGQMASMVPLVLRSLKRRQQMKSARRAATQSTELEQRISLLERHLKAGTVYFENGKILHASGHLGTTEPTPDPLVGQPIEQVVDAEVLAELSHTEGWLVTDSGAWLAESANLLGRPCQCIVYKPVEQNQGHPITAAADNVEPTSQYGLKTVLESLVASIETGSQNNLVVVELEKASLVRHSMPLFDFAQLMGLFQARLSDAVDAAPEPLTDHSFIVTTAQQPEQLVETLQSFLLALSEPLTDNAPRLSARAAVVPMNDADLSAEELLQLCYDLVGQARTGEVQIYRPSKAELALKDPIAALQSALENQQCELLYQPLVALAAVDGEYYEVLTQLRDDDGAILPARTFIRDAGRAEVGLMLDKYIVEAAMNALTSHLPRHPRTRLILNLTLSSLQSTDLVHWLQSATASIGDKAAVVFQFRETDIAVDVQSARMHVQSLQALGYAVCISQFGNLSNPLKMVEDVKPDWVKVDPSFIEGLKGNLDKQTELKSLCDGIHETGSRVIAPMVENPAILSQLYRVKCDMVQGHFLNKPEPQMEYEFSVEI